MSKQPERVTNHERLKQVNTALVYRLIDRHGPISRVSIAHQSALAPASVTNITRDLIRQNLVKEVAQQASTGGRPAISLTTNQQDFFFIACRLGRHAIYCSVNDLSGQVYHRQQAPIEAHRHQDIVKILRREIGQLLKAFDYHWVAVTITLAGLTDPTSGVIHYAPNHDIAGLNLSEALQDFGLPIYIGNDIRARALSEHYLGAAQHCDDFLLIHIHEGVGAGIFCDGHLLLGKNRPIAEIGHIQIDPFGQRCHCGSHGCLETLISNAAVIKQVTEYLHRGHASCLKAGQFTIEDVYEAACHNDPVALYQLERIATSLGQVLSSLLNVFNPDKVLFTGAISHSADRLFPLLMQQLHRQTIPSFLTHLQLGVSQFQHHETIGGYGLLKHALYDNQLLPHMMSGRSAPIDMRSKNTEMVNPDASEAND